MALSTYSELQASVLNWLARDSGDAIAAVVPDAIRLAEAKFNRNLRVAQMEASTTLTGSAGVFTLPADYLGFRQVRDASFGPLELVAPDWARDTYPTNAGGPPRFFTVTGSTLTTYPASTSVILDYYKSIPALSDSNTTNWLLTAHPDVYLWAALSEVNAYTKDAEAALMWNQRVMASLNEIAALDTQRRYSRVSARVKGPTP